MVKLDLPRMLAAVEAADDPEKLRTIIKNARQRAANELANAAFKKLVSILPSAKQGTVEHDFWKTVHAFEQVLTEERGKTTRLSRTRQKVGCTASRL